MGNQSVKSELQKPFEIAGEVIQPGTRRTLQIPLPGFYTNSAASMPLHVIHGKKPGPCLLVCSAIHGDELNGVEIIRRVLSHKSLNRLHGTLIAVPVVNVYGFVIRSRYLPDRRDLNRSFPGSEQGSMAGRLAHTFVTEIITRCTHVVDLHTGATGRENLPQIRAEFNGDAVTEAMARAFAVPVIMHSGLLEGSLREAISQRQLPVIVYEAGEALRFDEVAIRAGTQGVLNVMAYLEMRQVTKKRPPNSSPIAKSSQWVRATQSGVLRSFVASGTAVNAGDELGKINDPIGENEDSLVSPVTGIVVGKTNLPLVHEGEAIFNIATFSDADKISDKIESHRNQLDVSGPVSGLEETPLV